MAAAVVVLVSGGARADDFLLLRDGGHKRGVLSACDRSGCRLGTETVPRATIEWIGLDRKAPTPPAVRDQARDELHLVNQAVQSVTLTGVDSGFVHTTIGGSTFTAVSSLPRGSVAWIHLAHSGRPPDQATQKGEEKKPRDETKRDETGSGDAWRLPSRIYISIPRNCPTCYATLHVLDLKVEDDVILLVKSRTINISDGHRYGHWYSYHPPVPLFPATTDVARFAFETERTTRVTSSFYSADGAGSGARGPRQHSEYAGKASYQQTLHITNWPIVADELVSRRTPGWEKYQKLKQVPVYDVEFDLRFSLHDVVGRARDVDRDGYTTDSTIPGGSGPGSPVPQDAIAAPEPRPQEQADGAAPYLTGAAGRIRERAADWLRDRLAQDRETLGPGSGNASGSPQSGPAANGPPHAVTLGMRWFRAEGRITPRYRGDDIVRHVIDGEPGPFDYTVSATLPEGAFDIPRPPQWTPPNPRPPPRTPQFNWRP
jgi:hypothetical protein